MSELFNFSVQCAQKTDVYVPGKIHVKFYYNVTECEEERKKEFYNV